MMITGVSAVKAATSSLDLLGTSAPGSTGAASSSSAAGSDFGSVMKQMASNSIGTLEAGEATAIQGLQGAAPAYKVVEAVMGAQRTLQTALSIRDKAVSAFQEITRMSI